MADDCDILIDISEDSPINIDITEDNPINIELTGSADPMNFRELLDVPNSYSGQAGKIVQVKSTEDGLQFTDLPTSAIWGNITGTISNQTDLQDALDAKANLSGATFTGIITATNLSGTNTGDQTFITLGDTPVSYTSKEDYVVKVNSSATGLEFSQDLEFGLIEFQPRTAPATVTSTYNVMYLTSIGTTPNQEIALKIKNELGEEIILSTLLI